MNIQSIQPTQTTQPAINFKSAYPVVHWVAESNGSFAPVANLQIVKKLQGKIIRILNKPLAESKKPMNPMEQRLRAYIASCDANYRLVSVVRSFYNRITGNPSGFSPTSYIISGKDVSVFDNVLAKNIGRAQEYGAESPEAQAALRAYHNQGLNFVRNSARQIKDEKGMNYVLHTKFEVVRNKQGKIKDYRFLDARFLPASGARNPFERI